MVLSISLANAEDARLTTYQLGNKILSFHNTYQEAISETIDEMMAEVTSPATRTYLQTIKVFYTQASVDIATGSDPPVQLMDMMIMLRLQRLVWGSIDSSLVTQSQAESMSTTLHGLEKELLKLARMVFEQADINLILSLADNWKKQNPDREYIAFVRFTDLEESSEKARIQETIAKGGLFSSISETNVELEETRHKARGLLLALEK